MTKQKLMQLRIKAAQRAKTLIALLIFGEERTELKRQRDELAAELDKFMSSHEECTDFDGFTAPIVSMDDYHQAQEAIARVKGGE